MGVGSTTSYTLTRSEATSRMSSPSAYTSRILPECSSSMRILPGDAGWAGLNGPSGSLQLPLRGLVGRAFTPGRANNTTMPDGHALLHVRPLSRRSFEGRDRTVNSSLDCPYDEGYEQCAARRS